MVKIKNLITTLIISILIFLILVLYKNFFNKKSISLYKTSPILRRNIYQTIDATGNLEIKDTMKIGSLVGGTIKKILVKENDHVKKGQLLALIDNGKNDTDVKKAEGELKKVIAELKYQKRYHLRQYELFKANQISRDFFEQVTKNLEKLEANLIIAKANLKKYELEYNNTRIIAPNDGIVISVGISLGEKITTALDATMLFKVAKDLTKIEAELNIDESDIGFVQKQQKAEFTVSSYPDKLFKGFITSVSFAPNNNRGILSYKAHLLVNNKDMLLRPGMTINAKIKVAKSKRCLSVPIQAFQINSKLIKAIAKKLNFKIKEINKKIKKAFKAKCNKKDAVKTVWTVNKNMFIERPIIIGITDDNYYEIKLGLKENDTVITDIEESDKLKKVYAKIFKSAV